MCWACYTSLTGGATALAGAGGVGGAAIGATPMSDSGEKKSIDPKVLGIVGVCLLAAVGFGVNTMMSGGGGEDPLPAGGVIAPNKQPAKTTTTTSDPPINSGVAVANPIGPSPPTSTAVGEAQKTPYRMVSAPSLRYAGATIVIVPTQNNVTASEAKALASVAYTQILQQKKFSPVEILVFNDEQSAQLLSGYQARRRGAPLTLSDYTASDISSCWKQAILRQYSDGKRTVYSSPQTNPTNFWNNDSKS